MRTKKDEELHLTNTLNHIYNLIHAAAHRCNTIDNIKQLFVMPQEKANEFAKLGLPEGFPVVELLTSLLGEPKELD